MERLPPTMLDCPFRDDFPTFWSWQFPARHSWQRADGTNQSDMPIHLALKSLAWWNAQNDQDFGFNWHKFVRVLPWHSHLRTAIEKRHKYEQHRTTKQVFRHGANMCKLFSPKTKKAKKIQEILCTQCLSCQSTLPFNAAVLQSKCAGRTFREERKVGEPQCPQCADIICIWPKMTKGCLVTLRLPETTLSIQPPT